MSMSMVDFGGDEESGRSEKRERERKKSHPRPAEEAKIKEVSARGRTACETTAYKGNGQRGTRPVHDNDLTMRTGEHSEG